MSNLKSAMGLFDSMKPATSTVLPSGDDIKHTTETLTKTRGGTTLYWKGEAFEKHGKLYTRSVFWQVNAAGEKSTVQKSDPVLIDRTKSQASLLEQAIFNLKSDVNKKRDKLYLLPGEDPKSKLLKPMLAQTYVDHGHKIIYPCAVQPKYDGTRMVGDGDRLWSRNLKIAVEKCVEHLFFDTEGYTLDGELILPQPWSFEQTRSATTKFDPQVSPALIWRLYDVCDEDMDFKDRYRLLKDLVARATDKNPGLQLILTPTYRVNNDEDVQKYFEQFTKGDGEEGLMLRNLSGGYECDKRSYNLQKMKEFLDEEFEVVDISTNDKRTDEAQLVCKLNGVGDIDWNDPKDVDAKTFTASIIGTREYRNEIFNDPSMVVGKTWTVKYQGYTVKGKPRFPNAVRERNKDEE